MTLDELRNLNFRDAPNWPFPVKIGMLVILVIVIQIAGYFLDWQEQLETLDAARQKEQQLRATFIEKKRQAVNLDLYKKQLADIEHAFGQLLKQLPNKSEMAALLTDINQAGLGRGL